MVASIWATFIIGPFIEPSASVKARASAAASPRLSRLAPMRAASAPALAPNLAYRLARAEKRFASSSRVKEAPFRALVYGLITDEI